jgi:hypothetical protein
MQTRINQCRRLLLEAGADPTLNLDEYTLSNLTEALYSGPPVCKVRICRSGALLMCSAGISSIALGLGFGQPFYSYQRRCGIYLWEKSTADRVFKAELYLGRNAASASQSGCRCFRV